LLKSFDLKDENKDINVMLVDIYFRTNLEKETITYEKNILYESKLISNYQLNTEKVFQQFKKDWTIFLLKKRNSSTRNRAIYGYNVSMKAILNNGI
jgi:hypothetical protein